MNNTTYLVSVFDMIVLRTNTVGTLKELAQRALTSEGPITIYDHNDGAAFPIAQRRRLSNQFEHYYPLFYQELYSALSGKHVSRNPVERYLVV